MAMEGPILVREKCFDDWESKQLLECFRNADDISAKRVQLQELLGRIKMKYGQNPSRKTRKDMRNSRIDLYDNLLLLELGAEKKEWNSWSCAESAPKLWTEKFTSNLVPESIYTNLLDHIHDDEEIMFRFYHVQNDSRRIKLRTKAFFLVESIRSYRKHLVTSVLEALKEWEEGNDEVCKPLLDKAKQVFIEKVSSHGRCWSERSWRNRARLYWLLGLGKHAPISNGRVGNFKNFTYRGPIYYLLQKMINEDKEMLLEKFKDPLLDYTKEKYEKVKEKLQLGPFKICRLLAWASAAKDGDLVMCILQHKVEYMKRDESNYTWEESWKESWAIALWNAAYKGHDEIVKELLSCKFPYHETYSKYFSDKSMQPPLHVAVHKGHILVVDVFCKESRNLSCHEENIHQQTPLEVATNLKDAATKRKIQNILLQRPEVKEAVQESCTQRELTVGSANAIMVGATLIAGITYGGWLSPPLSFSSYYQFPETLPAPPDSYESYMSIQGHTTIEVFAIFNSLSFFCAIAAVVAGMETTCFIEALEETYMANTVKKLRYKLKWTTTLFIASVICVLIAFACAGIAILPPIKRYQRRMYITIGIGGTICMVFIGRMLLFCVSKRLYKWTTDQIGRIFPSGR